MNAETIVKLIEEMVDIKVHQHAEAQLRPRPEFAKLLEEKQFADRRRLELIKQELARQLGLSDGNPTAVVTEAACVSIDQSQFKH